MVRHIVMWKIKASADRDTASKKLKSVLENLKEKIDVIRDIEVGINFSSQGDASCDIVLNSTFDSAEELEIYQQHPAHLKAVEIIRSLTFERRVVDYNYQD